MNSVQAGEFKLEVVVLPVSDVDRAKEFYASLGWRLDARSPRSAIRMATVGCSRRSRRGCRVAEELPR
jgi:catechol 2,3-dioxygenase-like lactoylglutathione lyase family enzyme